MIRMLATLLALGAAIGCAVPDFRAKYDELLREQDQLRREKAEVEAELMALQSRRHQGPGPEEAEDHDARLDIRRRGDDTVIGIPSDVTFASGSAVLSGEGEGTMAEVLDYLRRSHPDGRLRVEGHSDSDPIRQTKSRFHCNWELSFARSHAVMHYLVDKGGLDPRRVVCESYGEWHPRDTEDKARNRRVEIVVGPARP